MFLKVLNLISLKICFFLTFKVNVRRQQTDVKCSTRNGYIQQMIGEKQQHKIEG